MVTNVKEFPFVSCLCPTFHRPKLLANALACFLAQDYPANRREMIILDDGNDFDFRNTLQHMRTQYGAMVRGVTHAERYPDLPAKCNAVAKLSQGDILVVWEDDDIYLPHHIRTHVEAMAAAHSGFSKPSEVLSTYPGHVVTEGAAGRFHASIAFSRNLFTRAKGWPATKRADFDQQFMMRLAGVAEGVVANPIQHGPPSYCFRYGSTQAYHGQHFMQSADDEGWYDRVPRQPGQRDLSLYPQFDDETKFVYERHSVPELQAAS